MVPRHVLGGPKFVPPSEKVNIALVGAGGQGLTNLKALLQEADAQIIALADPFEETNLMNFYYKTMAGRRPIRAVIEKHYVEKTPNFRCNDYEDFRVMLEKEKSIDAILCATPDHLHAYVSITSMRAGKHVFCEKPLTHNINEARQVAKVTKETGVATQMGNIGHSREGIRQTCEWIWDGAIGKVHEVHAWVGAKRWNPTLRGRPTDTPPVPKGANWDLWLGPRAVRPYHPAYAPVTWRDFWAFGGGALGDFGCHDMDTAMWALDLNHPESVEARPAGETNEEITPHGELIYYKFGQRGDKPPVILTWYDGGLQPTTPAELDSKIKLPSRGALFIGEKGKMLCEGAGGLPRLLPIEKNHEYKKPEKTLPRSKGHHRDWLDACKGCTAASANFEYGAKLTELALLGILSLRTGKIIDWDAEAMKARGVPEADAIIMGDYRKGWEI
ncbi:MAG: Gfo/Idh/MocA family oxidoreductase [Kiritimatiellae bacterium]|nr:Gfo/Idh/MocA family oxidoreductase [Kiritimatiellia bacterium]